MLAFVESNVHRLGSPKANVVPYDHRSPKVITHISSHLACVRASKELSL